MADALRDYAAGVAVTHGVDPGLFVAQINQESGFNPRAVSPAGAQGIAQFMPATAAGLGLSDPFDPYAALDAAARLDADLLARYHGDYALMLAAYNAGAGAVDRYGGVPPYAETQRYVAAILPALGSLPNPYAPAAAPSAAAPSGPGGLVLPSWAQLAPLPQLTITAAVAAAAYLVFSGGV